MKKFFFLLLLLSSYFLLAQEFMIHKNGFIYSNNTMNQLSYIVDSLNSKFKTCDLNQSYYSIPQAQAHIVSYTTTNVQELKKDFDNNISWKDFESKYPNVIIGKNRTVIRQKYTNYEKELIIEFSELAMGEYSFNNEIRYKYDSKYEGKTKKKWFYNYHKENDYSGESISAFYFTENFESIELSNNYSRLIQYSECLIDTNHSIFHTKDASWNLREKEFDNKIGEFIDYVEMNTPIKPRYNNFVNDTNKDYKGYHTAINEWDSLKTAYIDTKLSKKLKFKNLISTAVHNALKNKESTIELEKLTARYYSKSAALEMKRNRRVFGICGMDNSPRIHAMEIAVLAAETTNWDIFLRSHLDIMNDRFDRASDGSYAWKGRKTYIKELEDLNINVPDLALGISLRAKDLSKNHYYGNINRMGRALSESKFKKEMEDQMIHLMTDEQLDLYNRILIYYLYLNYAGNIEDQNEKKIVLKKLEKALNEFPQYLKTQAVTNRFIPVE